MNEALKTGVIQALSAKGVPKAKHDAKIAEAAQWWSRAGWACFIAFLFLCGACYVVYLQREHLTILLGIILAVPVGLPTLVALFCASQADGEATTAFVETVRSLVPFLRKKDA